MPAARIVHGRRTAPAALFVNIVKAALNSRTAIQQRRRRDAKAIASFCLLLAVTASQAAEVDVAKLPRATSRTVDFAKDIQPIFAENCYGCHGPKKQEAGFRLDQKSVALKGGDLGPAIAPGKSAESLLVHLVAGFRA